MTTTIIRGERGIQPFLDDIAADFVRTPFVPFMRGELADLATAHDFYFQLQVGPDGNRWPENADSTIAAKEHDVVLRGHPKNRQRLMRSLTRKSPSADAVRDVIQIGDNIYCVFGTNVEYSQYHNDFAGGGKLPFRPHVGVPPQYFDRFCGRAMDHALAHLVKLGRAA
jgi:hypothetical protein